MWGTRSVWTLGSEFWGGFFHSIDTERLPHPELLLGMLGDDRQNPMLLKLEKERFSVAEVLRRKSLPRGGGVDRLEVWLRCWRPSGPHPELGQEPGAPIPRGGGACQAVGAALSREVPGRHGDSLVLEDWAFAQRC